MPGRVLITGRGSIARRHAAQVRELLPQAQLAVVARGPVDEALRPCEVVASFEEGLAWRPDAVVVASVSSRHAQELGAVLEAGLPCLVEKPLVTSRDQLARLSAAPRSAPVQVGCNLRHLPVLRQVRELLHAGRLGRLARASLEVGQDLAQWRPSRELAATYSADPRQGGGVVFDLVHEIDMALWLLGPLGVVAAVGGHRSAMPVQSDDVHVALLRGADGLPATVALDYVAARPVRRYQFVAERGTLVCDLMARRLVLADASGERVLADRPEDFDVAATYRAQMADWLQAVADPAHAVTCPLDESLTTAALMLAMKEAA